VSDAGRGEGEAALPAARSLRLLAAVATAALAAAVGPSAARADGDPASDYLLAQNVYFPSQAPSSAAAHALERATADVYAHGDRIKVALVYEPVDLGAISSLFGRPADYAHFLGVELGLWYVGPLLVVMPAGFGFYDGGRSTTAEERALQALPVAGGGADDLTRSATSALERLAAADALRSPDVKAPLVTAHPASATRGKPATLRFDLFDDSGYSKALVRLYAGDSLLASLVSPVQFKVGTRKASVRWQVPTRLPGRRLRFCVIASDPAGNRSAPACAPFLRLA